MSTAASFTRQSGVLHLTKSFKHKRNARRWDKSNLCRDRLTKEDKRKITFAVMEPLYKMWCEYYLELVGTRDISPDDRMLKADYHGCLVMVNEATNKSQIGICGIVVLETRFTFQMITQQNKFVVIPKQGTTLQFVLDGRVFTLFGDAMKYKPSLRGKKQRLRQALPYLLR